MPSFTRKAIKETFLRQLSQRPLSQITVKDIVEECGINRNSFYYHFEDLPALVEEILREQMERLITAHPTIDSVEEGFDAIVEFAMENRRAIYHIYNSLSRDVFERHLMEVCRYIVSAYIDSAVPPNALDEADREALARFHKCACFGTVVDWLNGGMKSDMSDYFRRIHRLRLGWPEEDQPDKQPPSV